MVELRGSDGVFEPGSGVQSTRNRQIVEGALLADIAVVLLLGRVYLPIPIVRTVWRLLAAAPFVLLAQRQGIRITIMSGVVAYLLLTALVGPTLALTALDTAFAALIIAGALHFGLPRPLTAVLGGLIYAACDIVVPAIFFAIVFRVPFITIVHDVRNGMRGGFQIIAQMVRDANAVMAGVFGHGVVQLPAAGIQQLGDGLTAFLVAHWVTFALIVAAVAGIGNIFAYQAATDLVLNRLPDSSRRLQITT